MKFFLNWKVCNPSLLIPSNAYTLCNIEFIPSVFSPALSRSFNAISELLLFVLPIMYIISWVLTLPLFAIAFKTLALSFVKCVVGISAKILLSKFLSLRNCFNNETLSFFIKWEIYENSSSVIFLSFNNLIKEFLFSSVMLLNKPFLTKSLRLVKASINFLSVISFRFWINSGFCCVKYFISPWENPYRSNLFKYFCIEVKLSGSTSFKSCVKFWTLVEIFWVTLFIVELLKCEVSIDFFIAGVVIFLPTILIKDINLSSNIPYTYIK